MKQHKKLLINLVFAAVILAAAAVLLLVRKANQTGAPLCAELSYGDSNTRLTFPLEKTPITMWTPAISPSTSRSRTARPAL